MDDSIKAKDAESESLRAQILPLANAADTLREVSDRANVCRAALGSVRMETLASDLTALGTDSTGGSRKGRQQLLKDVEARMIAAQAGTALTLVEERCRNSRSALAAAVLSRDAALSVFPTGADVALVAAQNALAAGIVEKERVGIEFASLENTINGRKNRIDTALRGARTNVDKTKIAVETAQGGVTAAITDHASQDGRLIEMRRLRDAENIAAAKSGFREGTKRHAALPIPDRIVSDGGFTRLIDLGRALRRP